MLPIEGGGGGIKHNINPKSNNRSCCFAGDEITATRRQEWDLSLAPRINPNECACTALTYIYIFYAMHKNVAILFASLLSA